LKARARPVTLFGYTFANALERDYALELEAQRQADEIRHWTYESMRVRIGNGAWYKPDFVVITKDDYIELHEVKGRWMEAARVRIRAAAKQYPEYTFIAIQRKARKWTFERF
jgi:hypothetical protein